VREASRGLVGFDTSAHVLRLMDESRVGWEIQRPSRSMSMRGFDERQSRSSTSTLKLLKPRTFPIRRYQAGPSVPNGPDADKIRFHFQQFRKWTNWLVTLRCSLMQSYAGTTQRAMVSKLLDCRNLDSFECNRNQFASAQTGPQCKPRRENVSQVNERCTERFLSNDDHSVCPTLLKHQLQLTL